MFVRVITTIAVIVAIFVLVVQKPDPHGTSDGIGIPLTKRSDTDAREFHVTSHNANIIRGPSGMNGSERTTGTPHSSAVQRDGLAAGLELKSSENGIWYGTIWIGTPPKPFTVQINTGFSDLFVPSLTGDQNCRSHSALWDPATYQTTDTDIDLGFTIAFTDGRTASGTQYKDTVTIAGFTANSQTIGVATKYSPSLGEFMFLPDGVLGLGFPHLSQFLYQSPLLHTLFKEGKLSQPVFSLSLTHTGGELYVGGTNTALYVQNTLIWTPVTSRLVWQLMIHDIRINGRIVVENVPAIIDTGSNFISGDVPRVMAVHRAGGGGQFKNPIGYYTFPCGSFPIVTLTIGGMPIALNSNLLNRGQVRPNSPNCFSGILVAQNEHDLPWSLGTNFLEQVYTVFDFNSQSPRLGFAQLAGVV